MKAVEPEGVEKRQRKQFLTLDKYRTYAQIQEDEAKEVEAEKKRKRLEARMSAEEKIKLSMKRMEAEQAAAAELADP